MCLVSNSRSEGQIDRLLDRRRETEGPVDKTDGLTPKIPLLSKVHKKWIETKIPKCTFNK